MSERSSSLTFRGSTHWVWISPVCRIESPLVASDVMTKLGAGLGRAHRIQASHEQVLGRIREPGIATLWLAPRFGIQWYPVFRASVTELPGGGSIVEGRFTPTRSNQLFAAIGAGFVLFGIAGILLDEFQIGPGLLWIAAVIALVLLPDWLVRALRPNSITEPIRYVVEAVDGTVAAPPRARSSA